MNNLDKIAMDEAENHSKKAWGVYKDEPSGHTDMTLGDISENDFIDGFKSGYNYPKWVSVKDELPKELEALNGIEMPYECRFSCHLEGGLFISDESGDVVNITHWEYASLPPTK